MKNEKKNTNRKNSLCNSFEIFIFNAYTYIKQMLFSDILKCFHIILYLLKDNTLNNYFKETCEYLKRTS